MQDIQMGIDPLIQRIIGLYYAFGIWHKGDASKLRKFVRVLIFLFCSLSYPIALAGGGLVSNDLGDSIFLFTLGLIVAVLEFKGFYVFFKQDKILTLLNATCIQSVPNDEHLLQRGLTSIIMMLTSPLISHKLPFNIWFPVDYTKSHAAHWIAHCFLLINELFIILVSLLSSINWYIMLNCSIKYDILGYRFQNVGVQGRLDNQTISKSKNQNLFESELIKCIQMHKQIEKYGIIQVMKTNINSMGNFFSALYFVQIGTSAFCICGSVYILAADSSSRESLFFVCIGLLYYNTLDIFILMYLGNEIKESSSKLMYCLFESNWMEQTKSCKSAIVVLAVVLKRHRLIMVAKLYSLSLETFNAITHIAHTACLIF